MTQDPGISRVVTALKGASTSSPWLVPKTLERIRRRQIERRRSGRRFGMLTVAMTATVALLLVLRPGLDRSPAPTDATTIQFALDFPSASHVALVGDFNDWNNASTPLARGDGSHWSVSIPLRAGLYRFAYLVDGKTWAPDPARPGVRDDFGAAVSVLTVE